MSLADAAAKLKAGLLGNMEDVKIGDIIISALTGLSNPIQLDVTRKPIAAGYAITDAAVDVPTDIMLDVCLADPQLSADALLTAALDGSLESLTETWRDKLSRIKQTAADREIVSVQTHDEIVDNMLITLIDPTYDVDDNFDCWFGTIGLTQITTVQVGAEEAGLLDAAEEAVGGL